jgi:hypothetical protein
MNRKDRQDIVTLPTLRYTLLLIVPTPVLLVRACPDPVATGLSGRSTTTSEMAEKQFTKTIHRDEIEAG